MCNILIKAKVVDSLLLSITSGTVGLRSSTMNPSATEEIQGVGEIDLKSFFRSSPGYFLVTDETLAIFQTGGRRC